LNIGYLTYIFLFLFLANLLFYILEKKCENETLDIILKLYTKNKKINFQDITRLRKGIIPADAEIINRHL
jgi:hypothetical protein